jgi:hypothetical protein
MSRKGERMRLLTVQADPARQRPQPKLQNQKNAIAPWIGLE